MAWILTALVAGIALGAGAAYLVCSARLGAVSVERDHAREQADQLRGDRETMLNSYRSASIDALDRQTLAADQMMAPMRAVLERLETRLAQTEQERARLTTEMTSQVRSVQLTSEQLRQETAALVTALRKPQVRGAWGELQLKRVVEAAGMVDHCDFVTQETSSTDDSGIRPDMKVHLAGGKFVYVDAKTPLEPFLNAETAASQAERERALAGFAARVRLHIDQLSAKSYWKADTGTPEFVILFLPSEALYFTALEQAPDLIEYAAARSVIPASPAMLIGTLRVMSYAWTQEVLGQSAKEMAQLGRTLYERLGKLGSHFDRLGRSLEASVRSYNEAIGSLESRVLAPARRFRDLGVSEDGLGELVPVTTSPRGITAPELVAGKR